MSKERIKEDIAQALDAWTDVPEYVDFRYTSKDGEIIVSEYDDAMPGQVQRRFTIELVIKEIK